MSYSKFTAEEIELLQAHPYIIEVTPRKVCFSKEFKEIVWNRLQQGQDIHHIFDEFQIPSELFGETRINGMKYQIRKEGKAGQGFRDVHTPDYQNNGFKSQEKEIELLKQQLKYKDQEIEFLKKIVSLGQEGLNPIKIPASAKYGIIEQMMQREDNMLNIKWLCETAGVSRSGYYHYLQTADLREQREQKDRADFELILIAYNHRGYSKGARGVYMRFLHMDPPVHMNIKKIRRLMKKYGLFCPVRKANPYRRIAKALKTDSVADNLLNREFEAHGPRAILLTDITYIINGKAPRCYMSTIIDACTKELLAWVLSESLEIDFVLKTVEDAIAKHGIEMNTETMIHSDQGAHYTSVQFRSLLKDKELRQSMSRRANCWDNAPQESFYGHMKDEIDISECETYEQILAVITDWADYYNNERYQWDLAKLAPAEYYKYLKTGKYPLEIPKSNGQK